MSKLKLIAIELMLLLVAVLFLSSFIWDGPIITPPSHPVQDPILQQVTETSANVAAYSRELNTNSVPPEAKMDYAYARPWLEKAEAAAMTVPYSEALALQYAQQYGNWPPANEQPEQATRLDLMYAQQYGNWPHAR